MIQISGSTKLVILTLVLLVAFPGAPAATVRAKDADASDLVRLSSFAYERTDRPRMDVGGTDLAFDGSFIYAAEQGREGFGGGVHTYRTKGKSIRKMSFFPCGGWQNDIAVVRRGLLAIGYHQGEGNCGSTGGGVSLLDVSNPARPRLLGSTDDDAFRSQEKLAGVHTITPLPGTDYLYASPGSAFTQGTSEEVVIDVSDPRQPKIAGKFETRVGCHDLTLSIQEGRSLGFCSGIGGTEVWDLADPLSPELLNMIVHPFHAFHHASAITADGALLVIGTETLGNDCLGGPSGALLAYDVSNPQVPIYRGYFGAQRGSQPIYPGLADRNFDALCAPHLFNFKDDTRTLISGNGSGGVSVVDFSDPTKPEEIAHYMADDMPMVFAAYWHAGRIYANGSDSFDVFSLTRK